MGSFSVRINRMQDIASENQQLAGELAGLSRELQQIQNNLRFKVSQREQIRARIEEGIGEVEEEEKVMRKIASALEDITLLYIQAERELCGEGQIAARPVPQAMAEVPEEWGDSGWDFLSFLLEIGKDGFGFLGELGDVGTGYLAGPALGYIRAIYEFLSGSKSGTEGMNDLGNLAEKSGNLFEGMYKWLLNGMGENRAAAFQFQWGGIAKRAAVAGNALKFLSSLADVADTKGENGWKIGSDVLASAKELAKVGDAISSPKNPYWTIGSAVLSFCSEASETYGECVADGTFSLADCGNVLVTSAVSGLNELVSGVTFGLIDLEEEGVEMVADSIKDWAGNIGKGISQELMESPSLRMMYQNSNGVGRAAMVFSELLCPAYSEIVGGIGDWILENNSRSGAAMGGR